MENIIAIVTVCVTLLLGVGGFIINSLIQRKSNSISVITKTRLARREKTKSLMARMIKLSDKRFLDILDEEGKNNVISSLAEVSAEIRSEYTKTYACDIALIKITNQLSDSVIAYMNGSIDQKELDKVRTDYIKLFDIYIQTEWKRIKLETVGRMNKNTRPTWNDINDYYYQQYESLSDNK